ncbi:MAG: pilus assembly protein PilP [Burkholderiaceae bacterium]
MKPYFVVVACSAALFLSACTASDKEELDAWIKEQNARSKPKVPPLPEPKKFTPELYEQESQTDPFSNQKLTQALKREATQASANVALINPELSRRKEILESFPLDAIAMVGSLVQAGQPVALVKVDGLLYQVKPGSYLGQNYGRVMKITETEVSLREIVQDSGGEWIERGATLPLIEGK